ncbi:hypothetical protein PRZ48_011456 [Zasmidium cellare]|uniref:Uncharacterized protein n=1 Tax=Zasmidium cellare TaxID=395010 RepID=A0ABR0E6E9_ZASCE|nr:hypothetical protein PRZ48_011456 [Zasmidium cellare]
MKLATTLSPILVGVTAVLAAPAHSSTNTLSIRTPPDTGACFVYTDAVGSFQHYEVQVGRPYIGGFGHFGGNVEDYTCDGDGDGEDSTILHFLAGIGDLGVDNGHLMDAIREAYPMVSWENDECYVQPGLKKALDRRISHALDSTNALSIRTPADTGTCFSYSNRLNSYERYEIKVGRPYINGEGCDPIKDTIIAHMGTAVNYVCAHDGDDNTILGWVAGTGDVEEDNAKALDALHEAYPMVKWDGDSCIVKPVLKKTLTTRTTPDYATCESYTDYITQKQDYSITVGRPYIDGLGCEPIHITLIEHTGDVDGYQCHDDGNGGTLLTFQSGGFNLDDNAKVLDALHEAYPMVTFDELCDILPAKS